MHAGTFFPKFKFCYTKILLFWKQFVIYYWFLFGLTIDTVLCLKMICIRLHHKQFSCAWVCWHQTLGLKEAIYMRTGRWSKLSAEHVRYTGIERFLVVTMSRTSEVTEEVYGLVVGESSPKITRVLIGIST